MDAKSSILTSPMGFAFNPSTPSYSGIISKIADLYWSQSDEMILRYSQALFYTSAEVEVVHSWIRAIISDWTLVNFEYNFSRQVNPYSLIVESMLTRPNTFPIKVTISYY